MSPGYGGETVRNEGIIFHKIAPKFTAEQKKELGKLSKDRAAAGSRVSGKGRALELSKTVHDRRKLRGTGVLRLSDVKDKLDKQ